VLAGNGYKAAETVPAGWDLTSATCSDNSPVGNIDVSPGETVTCTFNNTLQRGKIVVKKETDPDGSTQSFDFTLKRGGTDVIPGFSLKDGESKDSGALLPQSDYDVTETVPDGWTLSSASCDQGETNVHDITVDPGQTVTCTFNNTLNRGKIVVDKVTEPSGDPQSFNFLLSGGPSNPSDNFSLTDAATPHESAPLLPGPGYDVTETVPADWELTSASCDQGETNVHDITVDPGQTVTCTFNNLKQITSIATEQSFTPQDTATITGAGSGTFDGLVDFELYKGDCETGDLVYFERNVDLQDGSATTTNGAASGANHDDPYNIEEGTAGTYHWLVSYHDDPNHPDATSCVEESTVSIDNDTNTP
jgi:hypothetical protein